MTCDSVNRSKCLTCGPYYQLSNDSCIKCQDGCKTCSTSNSCLTCQDRKYMNNGSCSDCDSTCLSCSDGTSNGCLSCDFDKILFNNQVIHLFSVSRVVRMDILPPKTQITRRCAKPAILLAKIVLKLPPRVSLVHRAIIFITQVAIPLVPAARTPPNKTE